MPSARPDATTYAEQVEADQSNLRAAGCLTHERYIAAMRIIIEEEVRAAEFMLAEHQLPIPWRGQR